MITRSGVYYSSLVKDFYTNITQKNNKDLITIKTTVNRGLAISFGSTSCIIFDDYAWKHSEASLRVGIHYRPNIRHSRTIWNTNDLSPRIRSVSCLIRTKLVLRSRKILNKLRVIDIYLMDKLLSASPVNLPCIIIHCMPDTVSTNMAHRVFSFPLLMDIFLHFNEEEEGEEAKGSDKECDDSNSSIQHSDALLILTKIYGRLFPKEGHKWHRGGEGASAL
ncbi:hypothetical protein M9H77_26674 [Catharanthus roseus]|uniref:Uncharacterized protein n=1 Tax=Catharanthus roseus TaxID=4058 RepID=A0ACC0AAT6_CATRO|nr:hypothetical protein M9H77_26674 [Catharanthus roseus]